MPFISILKREEVWKWEHGKSYRGSDVRLASFYISLPLSFSSNPNKTDPCINLNCGIVDIEKGLDRVLIWVHD